MGFSKCCCSPNIIAFFSCLCLVHAVIWTCKWWVDMVNDSFWCLFSAVAINFCQFFSRQSVWLSLRANILFHRLTVQSAAWNCGPISLSLALCRPEAILPFFLIPLIPHFSTFCSYLLVSFTFFLFFLSYSLHLFSCFSILSHSIRIIPFHFQTGYRRRRINLALVFCVCWFYSISQ